MAAAGKRARYAFTAARQANPAKRQGYGRRQAAGHKNGRQAAKHSGRRAAGQHGSGRAGGRGQAAGENGSAAGQAIEARRQAKA